MSLRTWLVVLSSIVLPAGHAAAATVFVRWEINFLTDPLTVSFSDASQSFFDAKHMADSSLTRGRFLTYSSATIDDPAVESSSGIGDELIFTNSNAFPVTIWAGTLSAHVEGTYSVVPPGSGVQTGTDSVVQVGVSTSGATGATYSAELAHSLRADGLPENDQNLLTPTTQGGATVSTSQSTTTNLVADLRMPTFTLQPDQTASLSFNVVVSALRNSSADFFSTGGAQLRLELPSGITLANDAAGPLEWVTVPEPRTVAILAPGVIALAGICRGRRPNRATPPQAG